MGRVLGCLVGLVLVGVMVVGIGFLLIVDPFEWNLVDIESPFGGGDVAVLPTHTPSSGGNESEIDATVPVPVTSSDDCEAVASASGLQITAQEARANAPRTLPNGQPFPGNEPRGFAQPQAARGAAGANLRGVAPGQDRIEVMIQFTPDSSNSDRNMYIQQIGGTTREEIDVLNTYVVQLRPNITIDSLPASDIVVLAEINETAVATQAQAAAPNDPRYAEQWAFPVVGLPQAWSSVPSGRDVTIAVVDSGICATHPDLQGKLVAGYDFVDDDMDPDDLYGHGCGVAGVIAAVSNNNQGIAGVAPNARIMPLRVLDGTGIGNYANIANAIIYAVDNGADIINLSLAGPTRSAIMEAAVAYAVGRGAVVIAAAGNFGSDATFYPAAYPAVIAVGSIDPDLNRSSFSNFGADVDVQAPGRDILTTSLNGGYEFMSGTSFAAPIVAGLTALTQAVDVPLNTEDGIVFIYPPENIPDCG